jgi:hypothetical protein
MFAISRHLARSACTLASNLKRDPLSLVDALAGDVLAFIDQRSRNFKTPYAEIFGLNIEQSLGRDWQLNVAYVVTCILPNSPRIVRVLR